MLSTFAHVIAPGAELAGLGLTFAGALRGLVALDRRHPRALHPYAGRHTPAAVEARAARRPTCEWCWHELEAVGADCATCADRNDPYGLYCEHGWELEDCDLCYVVHEREPDGDPVDLRGWDWTPERGWHLVDTYSGRHTAAA